MDYVRLKKVRYKDNNGNLVKAIEVLLTYGDILEMKPGLIKTQDHEWLGTTIVVKTKSIYPTDTYNVDGTVEFGSP